MSVTSYKYRQRIFFLFLLCVFDTIATIYGIEFCEAKEINPLMDILIQHSYIAFAITKIVLTALSVFVLYKYKNHPWSKVAINSLLLIYATLGMYHILGIFLYYG